MCVCVRGVTPGIKKGSKMIRAAGVGLRVSGFGCRFRHRKENMKLTSRSFMVE